MMQDLTKEFDAWQETKRWHRRMRHLGLCVKVLAGAFALAYLLIIWELF